MGSGFKVLRFEQAVWVEREWLSQVVATARFEMLPVLEGPDVDSMSDTA